MKEQLYKNLISEISSLIQGQQYPLSNYANTASAIFNALPGINWAGFYFLHESELYLGPFQGKPACVRIPIGKGVCGKAFQDRRPYIVDDVHSFPGHITCDPDSRSEIVIPLIKNDRAIGILDIDSPLTKQFNNIDLKYLSEITNLLTNNRE